MTAFQQQFIAELAELNERELSVVRNRIIIPKAKTLDELGTEFGVTRESIRLYEKRLRDTVDQILFGVSAPHIKKMRPKKSNNPESGYPIPQGVTARFRMDAFNQAAFIVDSMPRRAVLGFAGASEFIEDFTDYIPELDIIVGELVSFVTNGFRIHEGLVYVPDVESVRLQLAKAFVRNQSVPHLISMGLDTFMSEPVIEHLSPAQKITFLEKEGYSLVGELLFGPSARGQEDRAVAYLTLNPGKVATKTILKAIAPDASARSMIQRLKEDPRISRPDAEHFELAVNGKVKFSSIPAMMKMLVEEAGGSMPLDDIIQKVLEQRPEVSAASVRAYAERYPLRHSIGIVSLTLAAKRPTKTAAKTKNLYRLTSGWRLRLQLNSEHLRGSSVPMGMGLVNALALELNEPMGFTHELDGGSFTIKWDGSQPQLSSVKKVAEQLGAREGDFLLIDLLDNATAKVYLVRDDAIMPVAVRVQKLLGLQSDQSPLQWLPTMIGLDSGGKEAIVKALSSRQESDLSTLVDMI